MPRPPPRRAAPGLVAPLAGVFVRRSVLYWALVHLLFITLTAFSAALAGNPVDVLALLPGGSVPVVLLATVLGLVEARRRDEDFFLSNLGYGWPILAAYLGAPAAVLEILCTALRFG
jgi:hypothetical protein